MFKEVQQRAETLQLHNIIFAEPSDEVEKWMQAFDIFILPSNFEGLPVVGIESQAAGLPCLFSENISHQVQINENAEFLPIMMEKIPDWYENIIRMSALGEKRSKFSLQAMKSDFNIKNNAQQLKDLYQL